MAMVDAAPTLAKSLRLTFLSDMFLSFIGVLIYDSGIQHSILGVKIHACIFGSESGLFGDSERVVDALEDDFAHAGIEAQGRGDSEGDSRK